MIDDSLNEAIFLGANDLKHIYFHLQPLDDPLRYVWRGLRALMFSLEPRVVT